MNIPSSLDQFAGFIADRWLSGFDHTYEITRHGAWNMWRALNGGSNLPWACASLSQAAQRWSWSESGKLSFSELAGLLQAAMAAGDDASAAACCYRIFAWGQVARDPADPSRQWVGDRVGAGTLCADLHAALFLLSSHSPGPLDRFNISDLWMNSATTKLYAAADPQGQTAIYDGRVGAALGMLARQFLEKQGWPDVPAELAFMWGAPWGKRQVALRTRDPSSERYVFRKLPNGKYSHRPRAELGRRINALFRQVTDILARRGTITTMLELERACFMVGYRVR
jgi:hypothetical protein